MTAHIPKAELHCHIEGAASTELVLGQAAKYGVDIAHAIDGDRYLWHDFTSFLAAYDAAAGLFRSEEDYALLAETYLGSIAREGAIYSEIFTSPDHARLTGLSPDAYLNGLGEGIQPGSRGPWHRRADHHHLRAPFRRRSGSRGGALCGEPAARTGHRVGMGGEERMGSHADFAPAFDIARDAGLGITTHAGELVGAESVTDALDHVRPTRIGHGVRSVEDPAVVERLAREGVVLEVCPGSNVSLKVFEDHDAHPLLRLRDAGVKVALNSDDPPHFDTTLGKEYAMGQQAFGLSDAELVDITRTALEAAFVEENTRRALLAKL